MDLTPFKMRVVLSGNCGATPSPYTPFGIIGTVLKGIGHDQDADEALYGNPLDLPRILFSELPEYEIELYIRWDNNRCGTIWIGEAELISTSLPICSSIWDDSGIKWAPKELNLTPRTHYKHNRPKEAIQWEYKTNIPKTARKVAKAFELPKYHIEDNRVFVTGPDGRKIEVAGPTQSAPARPKKAGLHRKQYTFKVMEEAIRKTIEEIPIPVEELGVTSNPYSTVSSVVDNTTATAITTDVAPKRIRPIPTYYDYNYRGDDW